MHILAVIMIHLHEFCVYKEKKRKLKLPITCENFVYFALYQFLFYFVNICRGGGGDGGREICLSCSDKFIYLVLILFH